MCKMLSKEQNDEGCDASFYSAQAPQVMPKEQKAGLKKFLLFLSYLAAAERQYFTSYNKAILPRCIYNKE